MQVLQERVVGALERSKGTSERSKGASERSKGASERSKSTSEHVAGTLIRCCEYLGIDYSYFIVVYECSLRNRMILRIKLKYYQNY